MFLSLIINFLLFNLINKKYTDINYAIKYISLLHCIISSLGGVLYLNDFITFDSHQYIVNYSLGYIIYDCIIYTLYNEIKEEQLITYFHHSLFFIGIYYYPYQPFIYSNLILSELSTIPLNIRWIYSKQNNIVVKNICSYIFYISFFIFRILNCSYILYSLKKNIYYYLISIFTVLNYYWFYLMTKKLIRTFKK